MLIELLLVVGILGVLLGSALFLSLDIYKRHVLHTEQQILIGVLEKARSRAMNNISQSPHGVCFRDSHYILFQGDTCISNNPVNEYLPVHTHIAQMSDFDTRFPDIVFSQRYGTTSSVTIQMTDGVRPVNVTVNYEGTISW